MTPSRWGRSAWLALAGATLLRVALAASTELSPDEAYYLSAARLGAGKLVDHPPLLPWLLRLADRLPLPLELRVRSVAILTSLATFAVLLVARSAALERGAPSEGAPRIDPVLWIGAFALLPLTGGFIATPDGPALLAVAALAVLASRPTSSSEPRDLALALLCGALGALAKVVVIPVALALALGSTRSARARVAIAIGPLLALPWLLPSLTFQLHHAYGASIPWSALGSIGALLGAIVVQPLLWSPLMVLGLERRAWPRSSLWMVATITALVTLSALVRAIPPEPNWWAPAALVLLLHRRHDALSPGALALLLAPTLLVAAHATRPFLPLPLRLDPTARLHGWTTSSPPLEAPGVGPYALPAERCAYAHECDDLERHFKQMASTSQAPSSSSEEPGNR